MRESAPCRPGDTSPDGNRRPAPGLEWARRLGPLVMAVSMAAGCQRPEPRAAGPLWSRPEAARSIEASVRFTGTQIVVDNPTTELWREVEITVGREDHPPAFTCRVEAILGGRSVTVGALNFERPDGSRLSPFQLQPDRWALRVRLRDAAVGYAEGRF